MNVRPIAALMLVLGMPGCRLVDDDEIRLEDCPPAVRKTLVEEARGATIDEVSREVDDGVATYYAEVTLGGQTFGISVVEDGLLLGFGLAVDDEPMPLADCPAAVKRTIKDEAKGAAVDGVERETRLGETIYVAVAEIGGREYEIKVAGDGTLVEKVLIVAEGEIELADCPEAVRKTFAREARGAAIEEVRRSAGIGRKVYLAGVEIGGKSYDLEVAEDGTLLAKSLAEGD